VPFSPFSALEMLNNDIFDIFIDDLFGIFKNNAYLCNIKLKQQLKLPRRRIKSAQDYEYKQC
jgi:hypothetical protein